MNNPTIETLARRLDWVERENHRFKMTRVVVLVLIAVVVLMGQVTPKKAAKVVEAEKFALLDTNGKTRAILFAAPDVGTALTIAGNDGRSGITLAVSNGGDSSLTFFDATGKNRTALGVAPDQNPFVSLYDKSGLNRAILSLRKEAIVGLSFFDNDNKVRATFGLSADGSPGLNLYDANESRASVVLFGKDHRKVIWSAP